MSTQFGNGDHKITSEFLGLLVDLGMTPTEAFKSVEEILQKQGWSFAYFNNIEDFWIIDNEMK